MAGLPSLERIVRRLWHFLVRMDVASVLILVVLVLAALGSCFPQFSPMTSPTAESIQRWREGLQERYAALTHPLVTLGVFRFFSSPVFLTFLILLAVSTLFCTLNRWRELWRQVLNREPRCSEVAFEVAPFSAQLEAQGVDGFTQIARELLREHGFGVREVDESGTLYLRADRNRLTPLATLISHLSSVLLVIGAILSTIAGWREVVILAPNVPASPQHLSVLTLHYEDFTIQRYANGGVADYQAQVGLETSGGNIQYGSVSVNQPLKYVRVWIYLQGFEQTNEGDMLSLLLVYDPGYAWVIGAGMVLILGMAVSIYFPHACVRLRIRHGGEARLAGRADRQAYDFEREFMRLIEELERCGKNPGHPVGGAG